MKTENENRGIDNIPKKERALDRPSKYPLIDIFKDLKFGRPAESQKFLDKCISRLEEDSLNFSDAIEALYDGKIVAEVNWGNKVGEKPMSYLKLLRTNETDNEFNHNIINQPYIAKFTRNGGYMPHPYIPTSYEYMVGRFIVLDEVILDKCDAELESQNKDDDEIYGFILTNPRYEKAALAIIGCDEFLNSDGVHVVRPENIEKLLVAGVLYDWFYPISCNDINKFKSNKIDEMTSGGKCMVKYLKRNKTNNN